MKLSDLAAAPYNPREITDEALSGLKASLGDFGDLSGITWNRRTGHLVCGHQRLRALQEQHGAELRMAKGVISTPSGEQFKVREVDWSEEKERAANITANSPLISGSFTGELENILASLEHDYSEMFAPLRLDEMLGELQPPVPLVDDEVPELTKDPVTQAGDVWTLGDHRLACGDSTDAKVVARVMDGERADVLFTDPPYGMDLETDYTKLPKTAVDSTTYAPVRDDDGPFDARPLLNMFDSVREVLLWGGDWYYETLPRGGSWIVWNKRPHESSRGLVGNHFEMIWSMRRHRRELIDHHWVGFTASNPEFKREHPTEKPVAVLVRVLDGLGSGMDLVVDPFLGSGTTIIAAEQLNRRCFGIEIDPGYCDVIVERWENLTGGKATR